MSIRLIALVALALSINAPMAVHAQDGPARQELKRVDLDGVPGMEVITSLTEYKPGQLVPAHFHHGIESLYVVQGAMVQLPGKEPMALATGAALVNLRGVMHAGFTIVGDTSLKLLTVHVVDKGKPLYDTK